jgi:hypothetical protein
VGEKWVADDCSYLCKSLFQYDLKNTALSSKIKRGWVGVQCFLEMLQLSFLINKKLGKPRRGGIIFDFNH